MSNQLEKAINLAKITGDKIIIVDKDKSLVVISLEEYEKLAIKKSAEIKNAPLTNIKAFDKINSNTECFGTYTEEEENPENNMPENIDFGGDFEYPEEDDEEVAEDENLYYYNEEKKDEYDNNNIDFSAQESEDEEREDSNEKGYWDISSVIKKRAEEIEK